MRRKIILALALLLAGCEQSGCAPGETLELQGFMPIIIGKMIMMQPMYGCVAHDPKN